MTSRLTLILGGARSGKSRYAEQLATAIGGDVLFVATAEPNDDEMRHRIAVHRASRPVEWRTLEAASGVGPAIAAARPDPDVVLLDCLTLLANNVFGATANDDEAARSAGEAALEGEIDALLAVSRGSKARWLLVSNEVGLGLVPPYPLGRAYRDALGRANQRLAAAADDVLFMVAGLPLVVKGRDGLS
jgi:adenosylcobinamide kinase/adenosylcobinamide-phosphate guanylyltransferase